MEHQYNILIVDDIPANRFTLVSLLAQLKNIVTLEADSGEQALAIAVEQPIDLILLDIQMPGMDGYETARHFKMATNTRDIPIIFITAVFKSEEFARRGYQVGAVDYFTKPIDDNLLLNRILLYLKLFDRERKLRQTMEELQKKDQTLKNINKELELQVRERTVELNRANDAIISADEKGNVIFWNRGAELIFQYSEAEMLGKPLTRFLPEKHKKAHSLAIKQVITTGKLKLAGQVVELSGLRKNGSEFPIEISLSSWVASGGRFFSAVIRDISERKQAEKYLQIAKEKAELANHAKSAFLATMSHEIRTPMNAILGMAELLQETQLTTTQKWYIKTLNQSGESLMTLINDILDLSKIESGQLTMEKTAFNLRQSIDEVMELFTFTAFDTGIKLSHQIGEDVPRWMQGDQARLRQVLLNLIGNAVKFTQEGQVAIHVEAKTDDQVSFKISDTGPGIPKAKQEEIFQPFIQADASTTRKHGGTGLGLAICNKLIKLMGGRIELASEPGRGSTFTFTVPLQKVNISEVPKEKTDSSSTKLGATISKNSINILLAEDVEENQMVIEGFLRQSQFKLEIAENGAEAVEKFKNGSFDLVLMDIQMPVMDGYEATKTIRALETETGANPTPIVALTAHALQEEAQKIKDVGCNLHLTKPIRKARLIEVLGEFQQRKDVCTTPDSSSSPTSNTLEKPKLDTDSI